jgi:hypothetical protein
VLPGGGVDRLPVPPRRRALPTGLLKNRLAGRAAGGRTPLEVERIVGTSGGALLGFFVARLGAAGPWNLSEILWQRGDVPVDAADLFGWTDLPRYASLIAILSVFGLVVGGYSLRRDGWLSPPPREVYEDAITGRPAPGSRAVLLLPLVAILLITPLAVRWASGESLLEHIPSSRGCSSCAGSCWRCSATSAWSAGRRALTLPRQPAAARRAGGRARADGIPVFLARRSWRPIPRPLRRASPTACWWARHCRLRRAPSPAGHQAGLGGSRSGWRR